MNILILNWRDLKHEWAGGSEVYITELAKRWVQDGHGVTLFCGQDVRRKLPPEEVIDGIRIVRKGGKYSLYLWAAYYYLTSFRKKCDVVVDVQNGVPFLSVLYSRKPKVCVVHHVHGEQFFVELPFPYSLIGYIVEKYFFPLLYFRTQMMVVSKTTKEGLIKLGFRAKNITIVYNGIDIGYQNGNIAKRFTRPTILYLGRIKKYKRIDILIKCMPKILARVPEARLLIAGWGTEGALLTDQLMRSPVRKKVSIIGPVSDIEKRRLFAKSWVFVNPSMQEGWGITVIEASSFGTPGVAFRVPGLSESIKEGVSGLLVETNEELINAIVKILTDSVLRRRLARGAKEWAEKFSWDNSAKAGMKILKSLG